MWNFSPFAERMLDKFPGFPIFGKGLKLCVCVFFVRGGGAIFRLFGFFTSIALLFVSKDTLGSDNGPKQNFKTNLENLFSKRLVWDIRRNMLGASWGTHLQYHVEAVEVQCAASLFAMGI